MGRSISRVPIWLRHLSAVKEEVRGAAFPKTAADGLREVVALTTASLRILEGQVGADGLSALLARMVSEDQRRRRRWKRELEDCFRPRRRGP